MFNSTFLKSAFILAIAVTLVVGCDKAPEEYQGEGLKMEFVRIPAGSFQMGQPGSRESRNVRISKPFYMGKYEVTQAQWEAVMGTTLYQQRAKANVPWNLKGKGPEHPMYYVSWEDAVKFCKKLGGKFRLPTEAEWEYACRAGTQTRFYYGNDPNESELSQYAWWWDNSDCQTHAVGQKKPNSWDLHDMHGNVREWCSDPEPNIISYSTGGGLVDTTGFASANEPYRVCRGNSWLDKWGQGYDERGYGKEYFRFDDIGFRVVYTGRTGGDKQVLEIALPKEAARVAAQPKEESESQPRIISGIIRDGAGQQISSNVDIMPRRKGWILRDYDAGMFEMSWRPSEPNMPIQGYHLLAQNKKHNLAMVMEVDSEANNLDIQLKPGVILTGKVVDGNGKGIERASIFIYLQSSGWRPSNYWYSPDSDGEGKFEIRALPQGYDYVLSFHDQGHRTVETKIRFADVRDNRIDLGPIVLSKGQYSVSGIVVDKKNNPVDNALVDCTGENQAYIRTQTDAKGRFTASGIYEGPVIINVYKYKREGSSRVLWSGQKHTYSGAIDVMVILRYKTYPDGRK